MLAGIMHPNGYSDAQIAISGGLILFGGTLGMGLIGFIVDKTKAYKTLMNIAFFLSSVMLFWFSFTISAKTYNNGILYFVSILLGIFISCIMPLSLELCVETTYPLSEGTSSSVMLLVSEIMATLFAFVADYLEEQFKAGLLFYAISMSCAFFLFLICFKGTYLRMEAEKNNDTKNEHTSIIREDHTVYSKIES